MEINPDSFGVGHIGPTLLRDKLLKTTSDVIFLKSILCVGNQLVSFSFQQVFFGNRIFMCVF
jgi:hypothetical protein